jgi:hypothetical protein
MAEKNSKMDYSTVPKEKIDQIFSLWAMVGDVDQMKNAVKHGADPNFQFDNGATTLFLVTSTGKSELVRALIDLGARADLNCHDGIGPLTTCAFLGHHDVAQILLEAGADPFQKANNISPYDIAVHRKDELLVELFEKYTSAPANETLPENQPNNEKRSVFAAAKQWIAALFGRIGPRSDEREEKKVWPSLR